jgi:GT2 family glycosyltransferase
VDSGACALLPGSRNLLKNLPQLPRVANNYRLCMSTPLVSVVISCLNGTKWLPNCFAALRKQTIFDRMEVILVDDFSTDGTFDLGQKELASFPRAKVFRNAKPLGYTGGNNVGADAATGEWVYILNDDTQLEPDCLEKLLKAVEESKSDAAVPTLVEYDSMKEVFSAPMGFDVFGRPSWAPWDHDKPGNWHPCFMAGGAAFLIRREVWKKLGGFDATHFMYAEDDEISWRIWLAGHQSVYVKNAIMHHRSERGWEVKEFTRYLVNRNSLLVILKNAQHILLLCWLAQVMMLAAEALVMLVLSRSWKFMWNCYIKAVIDGLKMWRHILESRRYLRTIRKRSDWWMAKHFLRLRPNRWDMVVAFFFKGQRPVVKPAKS